MRNLKRALSVALAAVMLLGMMVIGAGAAGMSIDDFADKGEIVNKEAVALMVNLGILEGYQGANGPEFGPKNTLTRDALAKIAYMVATGTTDFSMYTKASPTFNDIKGNWAEGAIEYCTANGYISGVGDNAYAPLGKLTVAATAKVLLCALGFDADKQGYNSDSWSIFAMRDAKDNGLLKNVSQTGASEFITRENACQMAYNALFVNVRVPEYDRDMGEYYVKSYDVKPYTLGMSSYNLVKLTATVTDAKTLELVQPAGVTITDAGKKISASTLAITPDMVGSNVNVYAKATYNITAEGKIDSYTVTGLWSDSLVKAANNAKYTLTGPYKGKTGADAVAQLGTDKVLTMAESPVYYINGETEDTPDTYNGLIGKRGVVVEFKSNKDTEGKIDTVVITNKAVATLGAITTKTADGKTTVTITGIADCTNIPAANVPGYENLKKGDLVLWAKIGDTFNITKASSVQGVVSGIKTVGDVNQLNVNGTYYVASELANATADGYDTSKPDFKNTYSFYLDECNNIIKATRLTEETVTKYAVALDYGTLTSGSTLTGGTTFQAQLLFEDGTNGIVNITKFGGMTIVTKKSDDTETAKTQTTLDEIKANQNKFVAYSVDKNGNYELTLVAKDTTAKLDVTSVASAEIKNSTALFDGTTVANANTIFLVKKGKDTMSFKGIANVPGIASNKHSDGQIITVNGVAAYVYLNATAFKGDESSAQVAYIIDKDTYETTKDGYVFAAIVNGEKTTLTADKADHIGHEGLVNYKTVDGVITAAVTEVETATGIAAAAGGVLKLGEALDEKQVFQYSANTAVYVIDTEGGVTAISGDDITLDDNDEVYVEVVPATENASVIYIIKVPASE